LAGNAPIPFKIQPEAFRWLLQVKIHAAHRAGQRGLAALARPCKRYGRISAQAIQDELKD
jgi:hypothetical protein